MPDLFEFRDKVNAPLLKLAVKTVKFDTTQCHNKGK